MGVVRIYHARPEAMPDHGAHHGLGLQLVGDLHALGNPGQACGSGDLASVGVVRHSSADPARQTTVEITSMHSKAGLIAAALTKVSGFLKRIKATAEQLTQAERWRLILSAAFQNFLGGKVLGSTRRLAEAMG